MSRHELAARTHRGPAVNQGRSWRRALAGLVLACLTGGAACEAPSGASAPSASTSAQPADAEAARPVEIFSWWARVGESDALGAIERSHRSRHPGDSIINASAELSGLARKTLQGRMLRNEPPDTFQANVGYDLMQWVLLNGLDARESKLLPLDDVLPSDVAEWRRTMPAELIAQLSFDQKLYAVPSNLHRINTVFYNRKIFAEHGLREPTSLADLQGIIDKLAGSGVAPIALGSREPWTLALLFFECLLVAREGPKFYADYFRGNLSPDEPRVVQTIDAGLELLDAVNKNHAQLSWLQALELVVRGRAAMTVMGDWARVSFNAHGLQLGSDYGEFAFPGSGDTFVYTSDTFPLPAAAKNRSGATRLLRTLGSREGQLAMAQAKGSLPARFDLPPPEEPALRQKHTLAQAGPMVLALSGLVPALFAEDLARALAEAAQQRDREPVVQTLRSRYALLK